MCFLFYERITRRPLPAPSAPVSLALLLQSFDALFAMRVIFVPPLLLVKVLLEAHTHARPMTAPLRRVLIFNGLPVNLLAAQLPQEQSRSFWRTLSEDLPVEASEDQYVATPLDPRYADVACNGADASPYLQIDDCSNECATLTAMGCAGIGGS